MEITLIAVLFGAYLIGIGSNPPGFYVDESGLSYNAYMVSQTGGGEFGPRFPLFFQLFTGGFTQYSNPTQIYLLALVFWTFGPSILAARLLAAASMFAACLLLGGLAAKISGRRLTGIIVGLGALLTPWLFEVGRLVLETFFYPMAVMLFLWAVFSANRKGTWTWVNIAAIALSLSLVTYSYTIGRVLGPLLAVGLISFAVSKRRMIAVGITWLVFAATMIPMIIYGLQNPSLSTRFYLISYIKPQSEWGEIIGPFLSRFIEDLNPVTMLFKGDINPRHHIPDALGSFYFSLFILAVIGVAIVIIFHWRDPWWRFALYGLFASVVPGALTANPFHTFRMIAYPIFLLLLTVPAIDWLLGPPSKREADDVEGTADNHSRLPITLHYHSALRVVFFAFMIATFIEATYFHSQYYGRGSLRGYVFDAAYKEVYDAAVAQPERPIYLVDGYWGPAYIHSRWYATLEGRSPAEFVHQPYGVPPPPNSIVISSDRACTACQMIERKGDYLFYRTLPPP